MEIREVGRQEILPALHLIWEVFAKDVAPLYTPEGVGEFQKTIKYEQILRMYDEKELVFLGAYEGREPVGVIAIKPAGHIFLFFVRKSWQGRGVGTRLFQAACRYLSRRHGVRSITVNASPGAVNQYIHMGMRATAPEQFVHGMRFVPMEMYLPPEVFLNPSTQKNKDNKILLIVGIVIAALLFLILLGGGAFICARGIAGQMRDAERRLYEYYGEGPDEYAYGEGQNEYPYDGGTDAEEGGLDSIPEHVEKVLTYELGEDSYEFTDTEKQSTYIEFLVQYPVVKNLDSEVGEKVNEALKNCAMKSVDEIYNHPSEEIKETVLLAEYPTLASYVRYKVSYATEDFLSVVFEDYSYRGSSEAYVQNLRTVNISLKDGTVYELKDIVDIDRKFASVWIDKMRADEEFKDIFSELSKKELMDTLSGDSKGGKYVVNYFLDESGINIGYDLNYEENDPDDSGYIWITTSLTLDEVKPYARKSRFWELVD